MEIIQDPDKRLHTVCTEVVDFSEAAKIVDELTKVTKKVNRPFKIWLGMAANQIGHSKRIFILRNSYKDYLTVINPEIVEKQLQIITPSRCYSVKRLVSY